MLWWVIIVTSILFILLALFVATLLIFSHQTFIKFYVFGWPRIVLGIVRLLGVIVVGFYGKSDPNYGISPASWLAGLAYLIWEVVGCIWDWRKSSSSNSALAEAAEGGVKSLNLLRLEIQSLVKRRETLIHAHIHGRTLQRPKSHIEEVRSVLDPLNQINATLKAISNYFTSKYGNPDPVSQSFRIGFYIEESGKLVQLDSYASESTRSRVLKSFSIAADRFRLDNDTNPAQAVLCIKKGRMLIVSDCGKELAGFFHDSQADYLKSMVAYPIREFGVEGKSSTKASIVIDTNVVGYFKESEREPLETILDEFSLRLRYQYLLSILLGVPYKKVASDVNGSQPEITITGTNNRRGKNGKS